MRSTQEKQALLDNAQHMIRILKAERSDQIMTKIARDDALNEIWTLAQNVCEMTGEAARDALIEIQQIAGRFVVRS